jgi:predicted amidohydrolase
MFDEGRFWGRGRHLDVWDYDGWRLGLIVCEDFWHPGLVYALAHRNIQVLVVAAAAPGRGLRADPGPGRFASTDAWLGIARSTALLYGIWVVLANRVGVEGGVTFAGGSVAIAPDGTTLVQAGSDEAELRFDVSRSELRRARRSFAHARDDEASLVVRALVSPPPDGS